MFFRTSIKSKLINQARISTPLKLINYTAILILALLIHQEVYINANARIQLATDACVKCKSPEFLDVPKLVDDGHHARIDTKYLRENVTKSLATFTEKDGINQDANRSISRLRRAEAQKPEVVTTAEILTPDDNILVANLSDLDTAKASESKDLAPPLAEISPLSDHNDFENLTTSETATKGTMVLVASKLGQFKEIVPIDDLIVARAPEPIQTSTETQGLVDPQYDDNRIPQVDLARMSTQPDLAAVIAAGTAMGIQFGNLARARSNREVPMDSTTSQNGFDSNESRNIDQSTREPPLESAMEHERVPESMESLVRSSEQDDLVDPTDENDSSASNLVQDDEEKWSDKRLQAREPQRNPVKRKLRPKSKRDEDKDDFDYEIDGDRNFGAQLKRRVGLKNQRQPAIVPRRNPNQDLKAAAGHYYGKKKKKVKKVVKKKKKVIIKKKIKKYKVKKYKVKVVKKKKKKPKKYHHHDHGHDHGKYYMYAKVPKKKSWEFGFKKGNKKHWIERHEKGHKNKFKTKVKWYDKKSKGHGVHIWDYNHYDKKKHHG